ncbi:MAG: DUF3108 domain-containing protein [Candidatus Krumholzibacteria bacterium]
MRLHAWLFTFAFGIVVTACGDLLVAQTDSTATRETTAAADSAPDTLASPVHTTEAQDSFLPGFVPFGEGEKLVFAVQYGIITAGEATLEIRNISDIDGTPCYNIVSNARTNDVFSAFFKVRDRFVSLMDTTELVSLRYEKHLREGKFKRDEVATFDQKEHKAIYDEKVVRIAPRTQDILSSMYYVRTLPLSVGKVISLATHSNGKNYPLAVKVLREEKVTVDAGTFDCLVVEPFLEGAGLFNQKGRLTVWVTNDKYRIPVLMKTQVFIGAVSAVLKSYRLAYKLNHDEQVRSSGSE